MIFAVWIGLGVGVGSPPDRPGGGGGGNTPGAGNPIGLFLTLTYAGSGSSASASLTETLGLAHEAQLAQVTTTSALGFTPTAATLGGAPQTFQVGADGGVYVLAALGAYQTLTYTLSR